VGDDWKNQLPVMPNGFESAPLLPFNLQHPKRILYFRAKGLPCVIAARVVNQKTYK
jgi:hypothetical protein